MKILTASLCKIGGRDYNQDFVTVSASGSNACLVVCDGLGSYTGSEDASRLCAEKIKDLFEQVSEYDPARAVKRIYCEAYIENAHHFVTSHKERNPKIAQSCTTVACAITDGTSTTFAHIGDTRVYFFRNHKLTYQSKDHSLSQVAVELGQIKLRDIRTHKDQNKLTRVLGSDYFVQADIESLQKPLNAGDSILLCTDGFWEYVYEEEAEQDLASSATPEEALHKMEKRLLARIPRFNDNYSAIVAMCKED
ncbi:MAG: serine/threonine-protein phosphatase [Firmicutes bacterium]|nr:serine/threonine-protein phosphatase [Bacillota bacterium]